MKHLILSSLLGCCAFAAPFYAEDDWKVKAALLFSQLEDDGLAANIDLSDAFEEDANGFDLYLEHKISGSELDLSYLVGFNTIGFSGESQSFSDPSISVSGSLDDLNATAFYTGMKWNFPALWEGSSFHVRGEIGLGLTDDVDYSINVSGTGIQETALDGASDLYYGLGVGLTHEISNTGFDVSLGYQYRHYGSMDGNSGITVPTEDFDVNTSSFDLSVGYRF